MALIVNFSTIIDYSIDETIQAFVNLSTQHSNRCLRCTPRFFQHWINYAWVFATYKTKYASLIEPYKLGHISTDNFLDNLADIFYFMKNIDKNEARTLLTQAWNASIHSSKTTQNRFAHLVEEAKAQPVYLIANTNELNVQAILALLRKDHPELAFKEPIDISIIDSKEPVEILPNIFLCLSYRFRNFKAETASTMSILEDLSTTLELPITLVSQYPKDLEKADELGFFHAILPADEYYLSVENPLQHSHTH